MEDAFRVLRLCVGLDGWREAPAPRAGDGAGVFQVTVWFHGQPGWSAGEYPTRAAAAKAAAELVDVCGPHGQRPVGVGVMRRIHVESEETEPEEADTP